MNPLADLRRALGDAVHTGASAAAVLHDAEFPGLADQRPTAVVRARDFTEVAAALRVSAQHDEPVTVIGGSHGPRGAVDGVVCLDLRGIPRRTQLHATTVEATGSCRVRELLAADPTGERVVPAGVVDTPGMGLLTTAGVGGLTRSLGLSIDSLESVTLILADGSQAVVDAGADSDLWWAVRGAASRLGVVASARFRTHRVPVVHEGRVVTRIGALPVWAETAPTLPRGASLSWIATPATDGGEPLLMLAEVTSGARGFGSASAVTTLAGTPMLWQRSWSRAYRDPRPWTMPVLPAHSPPAAEDHRMDTVALWCSAAGMARIIDLIPRLLATAPNPLCHLQAQHAGGAMADVADADTAFFGRAAEYNVVATAMWSHRDDGSRSAALEWLRAAEETIEPAMLSRYAVDIRRGEPRQAAKVRQIYGPNLSRLRAVSDRVDPAGRFRYAPPF